MALHKRSDLLPVVFDDIYALGEGATLRLPKFHIPENSLRPRVAFDVVQDELMLDGNAKQNLATFCTTWVEPEVRRIMDIALVKNMIDKDEYPQTAELERRCVHMLADLWNSPSSSNTIGCSTTGSSEAAMLGGLAMKWKWRKRRLAEGKAVDKPNLVSGPVQVCWHKFARYWDVELREIPMEEGRFTASPEEVLKRVDENTIGVVLTLGLTFTGQYEPVKEVSEALDRLEAEAGLDIPIHVDAASGGFLAPFVDPELIWDFRLPRVKSINASGHKYGLAPLGVGWVVWRDVEDLDEDLIFNVNYLGGEMPTFALNFSRPGGQVVAQYYNFLRLGKDGYRRIQEACYETAEYIAAELDKMGIFDIVHGGKGGVPLVTWRMKEGVEESFNLFDLSDRLRTRGWLVPAYTLPSGNLQDVVVMRAVVRHGFSMDLAALLLQDIRREIDHLRKHPVATPLSSGEAAGFDHSGR